MKCRVNHSLKCRAENGFTLVETLLALAILTLLTGMVAVGVPMAFNTYSKAVSASNAQVLLTTATTELRNELGLASRVHPTGGNVDSFVSSNGYWARIVNGNGDDEGVIQIKYYAGADYPKNEDNLIEPIVSLVSKSAKTKELKLTFESISYSAGVFSVKNLKVKTADDHELASVAEYKIKATMLDEVE